MPGVVGKDLTLDSFIKGLEAIKGYKDIFNGPQVSFGPNIRQGANSSFLAQVKGGKWVRTGALYTPEGGAPGNSSEQPSHREFAVVGDSRAVVRRRRAGVR